MPHDFGMGSEREHSIILKTRVSGARINSQFKESEVIQQMIKFTAQVSGAVPFGMGHKKLSPIQLAPLLEDWSMNAEERETAQKIMEKEAWLPGIYLDEFGRIYEEGIGGYFECSTLTCKDPFGLLKRIRQGEQIAGFAAKNVATDEFRVLCFNAGSDRHGINSQSAGHHDNFLTSRENFNEIYRESRVRSWPGFSRRGTDFTSILVLRLPLICAGKINPEFSDEAAYYEISERAYFINHPISANTVGNRPLLNPRDEPHCNQARAHQINNDGNRSPWSILFNLGLTALAIDALAHEGLILPWKLEDPIKALHDLSRDICLNKEIPILRKRTGERDSKKPLELLLEILYSLERYTKISPLPSWCDLILGEAIELTERMQKGDFEKASRMIDWLIKMHYLKMRVEKKRGIFSDRIWGHPDAQGLDLGWHRLDNENLWLKVCGEMKVRDFEKYLYPYGKPEEATFWEAEAPEDTRSYLYWFLLQNSEFKKRISIDNWGYFSYRESADEKPTTVMIADLFRFNRKHLEMILREGFDFRTPEGRLRFIERLQEEGQPYKPPVLKDLSETPKVKRIPSVSEARQTSLARRSEIAGHHRRLLPIISEAIDDCQEAFRVMEIPQEATGPTHPQKRFPPIPTEDHKNWVKRVCRQKPQQQEPEDIYERSLGLLETVYKPV